jgi:hypothetical protein
VPHATENCHLLNTYGGAAEGLIVRRRRIADLGYHEDVRLCVRDWYVSVQDRPGPVRLKINAESFRGMGLTVGMTVPPAAPSWCARAAPRYGHD